MKTGGCLVKHARYYWLLLAESHLTRHLFGMMLRGSGHYRSQRAVGRCNKAVGQKKGLNGGVVSEKSLGTSDIWIVKLRHAEVSGVHD